jgi:molybdenum cofactor cytidylyltransferase
VFNKGHVIAPADLDTLGALNVITVTVAALDSTDLGENEAARRVGMAVAGHGVKVAAPGVGRANLTSQVYGPLRINVPLLEQVNNVDEGITVATLREYSLVYPGQLLALVKIIPFGVSAARVADIEAITREAMPVVSVRPLQARSVTLIVSGPASAQDRLMSSFEAPVRERIEKLGSHLDSICYVAHTSSAIAAAIRDEVQARRDLILLAGVSAIIDRDDVAPLALREAGGSMSHFGAPVDPGSLIMVGYIGDIPVVGAPGCIKSRQTNIIDWILPRLLTGERLTRTDFVMMGHGGLLDDISDRPMPRSASPED